MLRKNPVTLLIGRQKSKANLLSYLGVKLINVGKRSFTEKLHKFNWLYWGSRTCLVGWLGGTRECIFYSLVSLAERTECGKRSLADILHIIIHQLCRRSRTWSGGRRERWPKPLGPTGPRSRARRRRKRSEGNPGRSKCFFWSRFNMLKLRFNVMKELYIYFHKGIWNEYNVYSLPIIKIAWI